MSNREHPDRDSLSAYLEESLSIDATRWIRQHLEGCTPCRTKLAQERAFLEELDGLRSLRAPADFTQGVMARVAQYPAHQPAKDVPWKRYATWAGGAVAALFVVALFIGWAMVSADGQGLQVPTGGAAFTIAIEWTVTLWNNLQAVAPDVQGFIGMLFTISEVVRGAPLMVQLGLLLVFVGLNYALTRMVLNYQRRQ
jgi:predicted anti-sigma-YlaC factor YlaD